mmetsp:Transcript_10095/g.18205  ORF Transcript_10095/g.18205 Transcript_10095/m.18205 type:complete len:268 (-) Transcript_10095:244-1047(-)|eukprot:CAMPEP_0177760750 /NCGR_PEP_ID=MMETSP0491_2-20121128/5433_1 /TAXON_ID=63592 /ORGANISM="Tetraselmis chuii, Strain PLY429" /LENGTH=267 /DNA_ID=CAMNT_0019276669 /DNA_START=149 /DNA_END=952 /DNA_ORIENTATION=+
MSVLKPSEHQVAGHMNDGKAATLEDDQGRFFKPLQAGPRGAREFEFYELVKKKAEAGDATSAALVTFMPAYHGSTDLDGVKHIIVENLNYGYDKPSCMDLKIGFHTWYEAEWNSDEWIAKRKLKDEREGLGLLGFKLCGVNKWDQTVGAYQKRERDYWRSLASHDPVQDEFKGFAANGSGLTASDIYGEALKQLEAIEGWFASQEEYCFYGCSALLTYEGTAQTAGEAKVAVRLIDFAHSFDGQGKKDENFLGGLRNIMKMMREVME